MQLRGFGVASHHGDNVVVDTHVLQHGCGRGRLFVSRNERSGLFSPQPVGTLYLNQQFYRTETDKILSLSSRRRVVERYRDESHTDLDDNGVEQLKGVLTYPRSNSRLIDIGTTCRPVKAAALANLTAEVYRERNQFLTEIGIQRTQLSEQLEEYKTRIDTSNQALLAFAPKMTSMWKKPGSLASQFAEYSGYATISPMNSLPPM